MSKAVFAGSFDPFTLGHKDIVLRSKKIFDEVIVAVALDTGKNSRDIDMRKAIISASLDDVDVKIVGFEGLLTDFMKKIGADILVRGVRNAADYDYEKNLMGVYRSLMPELEYVLIPSKSELNHISSTVVRELCKMNAPISAYIETKAEKFVRELYAE